MNPETVQVFIVCHRPRALAGNELRESLFATTGFGYCFQQMLAARGNLQVVKLRTGTCRSVAEAGKRMLLGRPVDSNRAFDCFDYLFTNNNLDPKLQREIVAWIRAEYGEDTPKNIALALPRLEQGHSVGARLALNERGRRVGETLQTLAYKVAGTSARLRRNGVGLVVADELSVEIAIRFLQGHTLNDMLTIEEILLDHHDVVALTFQIHGEQAHYHSFEKIDILS